MTYCWSKMKGNEIGKVPKCREIYQPHGPNWEVKMRDVVFQTFKTQMSSVQIPGWLVYIEDYTTQLYTRWAPTSYKWSYNPYKWPYNWETGVISLLVGVITPLITGRGPPCINQPV